MGVVLVKIQLSERVYHELKTAMQHLYLTFLKNISNFGSKILTKNVKQPIFQASF